MDHANEINAFYDWLETHPISTQAGRLWHALMHIADRAGWPEEFPVTISVLEGKTGLSRSCVFTSRNELSESGRIIFKSRAGSQCAVYSIVPFESVTKTQSDTHSENCVFHKDTKSDAIADAKSDASDCVFLTDAKPDTNPDANAGSEDCVFQEDAKSDAITDANGCVFLEDANSDANADTNPKTAPDQPFASSQKTQSEPEWASIYNNLDSYIDKHSDTNSKLHGTSINNNPDSRIRL